MESARHNDLELLPLFGQALVACRLARRATLTMLTQNSQQVALEVCEWLDSITVNGCGWNRDLPAMQLLRRIELTKYNLAAIESVRWAFDCVGAAQGSLDFPVDSIVTASALRGIQAVCEDPRISYLQAMIVIGTDIDQIAFACKEARIGVYDGLTSYVQQRLTPCHVLTLIEPQQNIEDEYR